PLPTPRSSAVRDPQIPIGALAKRSPNLPAVSSLGGFRAPAPSHAPPSQRAGARNPRMRARESSANCGLGELRSDRQGVLPANLVSGGVLRSLTTIPAFGRGALCGGSNLHIGALTGPRVSAATTNHRPHLARES